MNHLIVDGFNLAYRSHYAFEALQARSGVQSGCVYGFLVGVRALKKKYSDCHITIAWDTESTRRKALYADYKSDRPKITIAEQISDLKEIFLNLNASQAEYPGEEADDVIATLTKVYFEDKNQIFIYTQDKDMLQLVRNGKVMVIRPKKGSSPERIYDEEAVKNEFGVDPKDLVCYFSFRGDPIDSVPGVPRLTSTFLARLAIKYKTPVDVYAHLAEETLSDFQNQSLKSFREQVLLNYSLVKLVDDLHLNIKQGKTDPEKLTPYLKKYEIASIDPEMFANSLKDISTFNKRTAPAIQTVSFF